VPPEMVLPVFVSVVFFIALLISYPWYILSVGTVIYLASLPVGWKSYRDHKRKADAAQAASTAAVQSAGPTPASPFVSTIADTQDNRPSRLN
jgi:CDP-diacylglycerol---serine O-phosphatidyltransferase